MLLRKMLRDIARQRMQFLSIFLMSFLGMFVFAGIGGEWMGLQNTADGFYAETGLADMWLYAERFTDDDLAAARAVEGVLEAGRRLTLETAGNYPSKPTVSINFIEDGSLSTFLVMEGRPFADERDSVWVDARFARAMGLSLGDSLSVSFEGFTVTKEIAGLVYGGEYVFHGGEDDMLPDPATAGFAFAGKSAFPLPAAIPYTTLLIRTDRTDLARLEAELLEALGKNAVVLTRKTHPSAAAFQAEIEQHRAMGQIFPLAFFLIALLMILTTMTRLIAAQRTQIGTLKALGFSKGKILLHYIGYGFILSLAGSLLGAAIGPMILPPLFYPSMSAFFALPEWKPHISPLFYLIAFLFSLACTFAGYWACRRVLGLSPAAALRPKTPRAFRRSRLEGTRLWQRLSFTAQWNLRDSLRGKARTCMALVGVLACMALLVCAFGMRDTMRDTRRWQYEEINRFATQLTLSPTAAPDDIAAVRERMRGDAIMTRTVEIMAGDTKRTATLTVHDGTDMLLVMDARRQVIGLPEDGVSLSAKMAELLGAGVGEIISFRAYGEEVWTQAPVRAIHRNPSTQGIDMRADYYTGLGLAFMPTAILSPLADPGEALPGVESIRTTDDLAHTWDQFTQSMDIMVYLLIAAALVLAIVVLYNLGLLSFTERERELATLKVLGFGTGRIRGLLVNENLLIAAIGVVLGLPAGWLLIDVMISTMSDGYDMATYVSAFTLLLSAAVTVGVSLLVTWLFSGRIRRIDMAGSLKAME